MKHTRTLTRTPQQANTTLAILATFFVYFVDAISNIWFQKQIRL